MPNNTRSNLPWISSDIPPDLRQFLERVRETLSGNEFVRRLDYLGGSIPRNPIDPPGPPPPPPPRPCGAAVTPTAPTGLQVAAGFEGFLLSWDMPGYCGHSHTEVYGLRRDGTSAELGVQNMLGESHGVLYSHVVGIPEDYWCFWIKHVNVDDVEGPFTGAGVCAKTALDPGAVIEVLEGKITETELYRTLGDKIKLIDVSQPVSTLTSMAYLSGRVIYSATAPTNATVEPDLTAGDLWVETDAVYPDATSVNLTYRWTGAAWVLLDRNKRNQLSTAVIDETVFRADADSIEASQREGLFAGAFAGIGNAYRYFVQEAAPTNATVEPDLRIGDIWSWRNPNLDPAAIFKRWNGATWKVVTPEAGRPNADTNRRAARFLGASNVVVGTVPPFTPGAPATTDGYVIGDQFLWTAAELPTTPATANPNRNKTYRYNFTTVGVWQVMVEDSPESMAAALVYTEKTARVSEDAALASRLDLVYASLSGDSRPNLCPNAALEEYSPGLFVNASDFSVLSTDYGQSLRKGGPFSGTGDVQWQSFTTVAARRYAATANLQILGTTVQARVGLNFYTSANGSGTAVATVWGAWLPGPMSFDDEYVVGTARYPQRARLLVVGTAPPNTVSARLLVQWQVTGGTVVSITRPQVVVITDREQSLCVDGAVTDLTIGTCPMPAFNYDSTSAMVADVATARIGYCTKRPKVPVGDWLTTADSTKQACIETVHADAATYEYQWNQGLPWATAVKQVAVTTADFCVVNGVVDKTKTTSGACATAGGTWNLGGTAALEQNFQAQQETNGTLSAQYTVKIDNNGFICGFGLASTSTEDGTPYSEFMVRADRFSISSPQVPGIAVTALTKADTVATLTTAVAHGLSGAGLFSLRGIVNDSRWSKVWRVATVVSTTRITFAVPVELQTPDLTASPTLIKVTLPFIVTTTDSYDYGPAVVTLTSAMLATMSTAYPLRISILNDTTTVGNYATCPVPASGTALTASALMDSINNTAATKALVAATLGDAAGSVVISTNTAGNFTLKVQYTTVAFSSVPCPTKGTVIPAGVYISDAYIKNATINWAQINRATIDWLDVTRQLKAEHIIAGSINVDDCLGSSNYVAGSTGWQVCGAGNAEFNNVTFRGSLLGNTTGFTDGNTGIFIGKDTDSVWKLRVGDGAAVATNIVKPSLRWNGTNLNVFAAGKQLMRFGSGGAGDCFIRSADYEFNQFGWTINGDGSAEFDTIHLRRGAISALAYKDGTPATVWGCDVWASGIPYSIGTVVWSTSRKSLYWCTLGHTSSASILVTNTTYWVPWNDADATFINPWNSATLYPVGTRTWSTTHNAVYISRTTSNTNRPLPVSASTPYETYWIKHTHNQILTPTPVAIDLTGGDTTLGSIFHARFDASMSIASAAPWDRIVDSEDLLVRLVLYNASGRRVLAVGGYYLAHVGKLSTGNYLYASSISDFTRVESGTAAVGQVRLEAANFHGVGARPISATSVVLMAHGAKR